jgi:hypothetical protein
MTDEVIIGRADLESASGDLVKIGPSTPVGHVMITMTPQFSLVMYDIDPSNPYKFVHELNGETYLAALADSVIQISLDPNFSWEFNKRKGLLLFKDGQHSPYYRIQYLPNQKPLRDLVLHVKSTGKPQTNPQTHAFDLHLIIQQQSASGRPGRPLPMTIDPDVKNPPPIGSGPSMVPVPVLSASA